MEPVIHDTWCDRACCYCSTCDVQVCREGMDLESWAIVVEEFLIRHNEGTEILL